jgi:hypothetical protein
LGENFDAALALRDLPQQFEPVGMAEGLGHRGELGKQRLLRALA